MIFDLELKKRAFGFESPMAWAFSKDGENVEVTKKGYLFLVLFWVTFFSFGFWYFYMSPCVKPPTVDVTVLSLALAFNTGHELSDIACVIAFDQNHEVSYYLQLIGRYDPANQFSALLGISLNYSNYIKSIPYKFA